jgi:chemotaxis protein MotB
VRPQAISYRKPANESGTAAAGHVTALSTARWAEDEPNWLVTLSDLTLLLLCFLVVWHVQAAKGTAPAVDSQTVQTAEDSEAPPLEDQWAELRDQMQTVIAAQGLNGKIQAENVSGGFVISIADTVSFDSASADFRPEFRSVLEAVVVTVQARPSLSVEVSGHTDSRRIATAKFPSNWELSTARASAVARYLIEKGVDASRIEARGYANQRPRAPETDGAGSSVNRRVEIRLNPSAESDGSGETSDSAAQ